MDNNATTRFASRASLFVALFAMHIGCAAVSETKNIYFDYEKTSAQSEHGAVYVSFSPTPGDQSAGDEIEIVWGGPYRFNSQYISVGNSLIRGEILDVEIRSMQSGDIVFSKSRLVDSLTLRNNSSPTAPQARELIGFGAGPLDIEFDDFEVSFRFEIYSNNDELFDKGAVNTVVKRKYYEKMLGSE